MWWLLSVLTFCGMPSLLADVCSGLPASPPTTRICGGPTKRLPSSCP
jgi:hypothetical protein